ncbi:MAG: DeoR family transcriptional regulator [Bacteroidales bacterium]
MLNLRQNEILKILGDNEQTSVRTLSDRLQVSSVTIRQDLNLLEEEGLLKRVHGGAVLKDADDLDSRLGVHYDRKLKIARRLASHVCEGETILIESGSVNALLARELARLRQVTVVTSNVYIARQFRKSKGTSVILLGGIYQHESESLVGMMTRACIDQLHLQKAFMGIDGYTREGGFMLRDLLRAEISSYIIRKAEEVFIVSDASKFDRPGLTNICEMSDIRHIATNKDLNPAFMEEFRDAGIDLILA